MRVIALWWRVGVIPWIRIFRHAPWKRAAQKIRVCSRWGCVPPCSIVDIQQVFVDHHHAGRCVMTKQWRWRRSNDWWWWRWRHTMWWRYAMRWKVDRTSWSVPVKWFWSRQRKIWVWVRKAGPCVGIRVGIRCVAEMSRVSRCNVESWK